MARVHVPVGAVDLPGGGGPPPAGQPGARRRRQPGGRVVVAPILANDPSPWSPGPGTRSGRARARRTAAASWSRRRGRRAGVGRLTRLTLAEPRTRLLDPDDIPGGQWACAASTPTSASSPASPGAVAAGVPAPQRRTDPDPAGRVGSWTSTSTTSPACACPTTPGACSSRGSPPLRWRSSAGGCPTPSTPASRSRTRWCSRRATPTARRPPVRSCSSPRTSAASPSTPTSSRARRGLSPRTHAPRSPSCGSRSCVRSS